MRPEHPPGCTASRRRRSSRPSCERRLRTLPAAASVRPTPCAAVPAVVVLSIMVMPTILRAAFEICEQHGLGEDRALENSEMQGLVRAVRAGVGILDPRDEDLGGREYLNEIRDEGDGTADPRLDRRLAPGLAHGILGLGDRPPRRIDEEAV